MSHSVTVTRTVTTSSTNVIMVNTGYCRSATGLLKVFETIIGAICLALIAYYCTHYPSNNYVYSRGGFGGGKEETLFFLVTFAFLTTTFLLLLACLISISSAALLPKSTFESLYHFVAFIFYIAASIALLIELNRRNDYRRHHYEYGYEGKMAASSLGIVNSVLYALSFFFSIRTFRIA